MNGIPDNEQVAKPPGDDDEALREYGRQLALDSLLGLALGDSRAPAAAAARTLSPPRAGGRRWRAAVVVAACLVVAATAGIWFRNSGRNRLQVARGIVDDTIEPAITQLAAWRIESIGAAAFQVIEPRRIRLDRGELHITSPSADGEDDDETLEIETPVGIATARIATNCFIGTHEFHLSTPQGAPMLKQLTRVLVLAGIVALANRQGTSTGEQGHLLAAEPDAPPVDLALQANNDFAFDLYRQLAEDQPGRNLFFSPYSLSSALAMTAEGARGETAEQMARVLRFPDAARRLGDDAQAIPFNVALIHTGIASLNERFRQNDDDASRKVRTEIDSLRKELNEANRRADALRKAGNLEESNQHALRSQELAGRLNALLTRVDQFELRVANALWGERTYPFRQSYIDTIDRYYRTGGVFPTDFVGDFEGSRRRINAWIEEQTNQRITELLPAKAFSGDERDQIRLVLTNAIYFRGEWSQVFPAEATQEDDFLLANGTRMRIPMMHHGNLGSGRYAAFNGDGTFFTTPIEVPVRGNQPPRYPDDDGFAVLELPYKGGELSMVLIAPRAAGGLESLEERLSPENLAGWISRLQSRTIDTSLPRFKLESSSDMVSALKSLGMVRPFIDPGLADGAQFEGMCVNQDPRLSLYLSKVLHKARVEVTEKGTEAAAATAVITVPPPTPIPETVPFTPTFKADRPFLFVIRDRPTGTFVFMGRVVNPQ